MRFPAFPTDNHVQIDVEREMDETIYFLLILIPIVCGYIGKIRPKVEISFFYQKISQNDGTEISGFSN